MWNGSIAGIYIAPDARAAMVPVKGVRAVVGRGLEGDRYFKQTGTYSGSPGPSREVTFIEMEAIEALKRDYGIQLEPRESRRNIVTRGVPLNHLVGRDFTVGESVLRGIRLCEPCHHLEQLAGKKVLSGLVHRAGLRAQVLKEGVIRVGDPVQMLEP